MVGRKALFIGRGRTFAKRKGRVLPRLRCLLDPLITSEMSTDRQLSRYVFFLFPVQFNNQHLVFTDFCVRSRISMYESQMPAWSYHGVQVWVYGAMKGLWRWTGMCVNTHRLFVLHLLRSTTTQSCLKIN